MTYGHTVSEEGSIAGGLGLIGGDGEAVLLPVHQDGVVVGKVGVLKVLPLGKLKKKVIHATFEKKNELTSMSGFPSSFVMRSKVKDGTQEKETSPLPLRS